MKRVLEISLCLLFIFRGVLVLAGNTDLNQALSNNESNRLLGVTLCLAGIIVVIQSKQGRILKGILVFTAWLILCLISYGAYVNSGYVPEQIIEHSLQLGLPIFYLISLMSKGGKWDAMYPVLILTALTFIGHAFFAWGVHYQPKSFTNMMVTILNVDPISASVLLKIFALLDVAFAIGIFIKPLRRVSLVYLVLWGFATSFARFLYGLEVAVGVEMLTNFVPNFLYRLLHGLVPLGILIHIYGVRFYKGPLFNLIVSGFNKERHVIAQDL